MTRCNIIITLLGAVLFSLAEMSCTSPNQQEQKEEYAEMNRDHGNPVIVFRAIEANAEKNPATTPLIEAYLQIKNALVADDREAAAKGGAKLSNAFAVFDGAKLQPDTYKVYTEIMSSAQQHGEHIAKSGIEHQREHFEALSADINDLIALLGTEKTLYHDYCPMARNDQGAYWISETKEIRNPYFGSEMLRCGSIKKQIN